MRSLRGDDDNNDRFDYPRQPARRILPASIRFILALARTETTLAFEINATSRSPSPESAIVLTGIGFGCYLSFTASGTNAAESRAGQQQN